MTTRIHKLCLIRGFTEAYHQLSEDERAKLWQQVEEVLKNAGVKSSGPTYNCRWSNDKYHSFFILEYPNIEAAMADTAGVEEVGLFRYIVSETILAVAEPESVQDTGTPGI
jgi:hypothetical protein